MHSQELAELAQKLGLPDPNRDIYQETVDALGYDPLAGDE